jgi:hypothetical protein
MRIRSPETRRKSNLAGFLHSRQMWYKTQVLGQTRRIIADITYENLREKIACRHLPDYYNTDLINNYRTVH